MLLALLPRYLYKSWKFAFRPDDIDILRYVYKQDPNRDLAHDLKAHEPLQALKRSRPASMASHASHRRPDSFASVHRPSIDIRSGSRTDMSTGLRSISRGFGFDQEENGVAMQRIQTNLSERRQSSRNLATAHAPRSRRGTLRHVLSSSKHFLRKKGSHSKDAEQ